MDTRTEIEQVEEMLELGRCMGPGERYLMLYEALPAITNRTGLAWWPKGDRRVIAVFDAADCVTGLTSRQWEQILDRLSKAKGASDASGGSKHRSGQEACSGRRAADAHPT